jgi:hypothetical protein
MTRSMTRWTLAGCMALAAMGAVAVLDVGFPTAQAEPSVSPFAGNWSGTWVGDNGQDGTLDWTISDSGQLTGRVSHTQDGQSGEVRGRVRADGFIVMIAFAPSDDPLHGNGVPLQGTAEIDGDTLNALIEDTGSEPSGNDNTFVLVLERN